MNDWSMAAVNAAELLDSLEEEFSGTDFDIEVGRVMIVVEVTETRDDGEEFTGIHFRCSDPKRWIQAGMLEVAKRAVYASGEEGES